MDFVTRINLKTLSYNRENLINFCLNNKKQYLAIGWSYIYQNKEICDSITDFKKYYYAIKEDYETKKRRTNPVLNIFLNAKENDLFWTRDCNGYYWICRAIGLAMPYFDKEMDIGAILPIEAYKVGLEIPGQIKASFNKRSGTAEKIKALNIIEYSKYMYNLKSGTSFYEYEEFNGDFLHNLPDFELEELVISYLQLKENYYVLSNSIANKSTTVKIECELISRDISKFRKAVVQVKGGYTEQINANDYQNYVNDGYLVYLFAPSIINKKENIIEITRNELLLFYQEYKKILPDSITKWENLFK